MNDRAQAIALGTIRSGDRTVCAGLRTAGRRGVRGDGGGAAARVNSAARRRTGGGGRGGFLLGGRAARGQSPYQGTATYTFGGSALNTPPYQINPARARHAAPVCAEHVRHHVRRTAEDSGTLQRHQSADEFSGELHGQSIGQRLRSVRDRPDGCRCEPATSPAAAVQLFNPATGQPFAGNQIPAGMLNPASQYLLGFIPPPNLPGDQLNYHTSTVAHSSSDSLSLRFTQNLSPTVPQNGRGPGGGRGGGFRRPRWIRRTRRSGRSRHEHRPAGTAAVPARRRAKR